MMEKKTMRIAALVLVVTGVLGATGCAASGTAEDFTWAVDCPKTIDRGSEFNVTVRSSKSMEAEAGLEQKEISGVTYHWQIQWPGGSSAPLLHAARSGEVLKIRARLSPGPATLLITSVNKSGLDVKVAELSVEVK
jgi:hypothetical protein